MQFDMPETSQKRLTLRGRFLQLWRSHNSPHEISLGIAIGVFIGITPFYGFHIIMASLVAVTMRRVNKLAIFLGMNISLPPTIPLITWAGYSIGRAILGREYPPVVWEDFRHFYDGTFFHFFYALLVGSLFLGIGLSCFFYFLTFWFFKRRRAEKFA